MTVAQLIDKLQQFNPDLPVAVNYDINYVTKDCPDYIEVGLCTWVHSNYPYNKPDFNYVNLG